MTTSNIDYSKYAGVKVTDLGTPIIKKGQELDKNAFLKILSAELSNQDPTADVDSTKYISQLAQFSSMEQMTNLNTTMTNYANQNMIGKGATVSNTNADGIPYTGVIKSVTTTANGSKISMEVNENGQNTYKEFPIENVVSVVTVPDYTLSSLSSLNGNMSFLMTSSFIGKNVEITDVNNDGSLMKPVKGTVKGTYKEKGMIMVRVQMESGEIENYSYDKITKVGDFQ